MKRRNRLRECGVSLIELLMALAITAMVMVPVVAMLDLSVDAGAAAGNRQPLQQDANFALERIAAQVRGTPRKTLDPNALASDSESWFAARFSKKGDQLIERFSGTERVIADGVTTFSITARAVGTNNTLVETTLALQRGADAATATTLHRLGGAP